MLDADLLYTYLQIESIPVGWRTARWETVDAQQPQDDVTPGRWGGGVPHMNKFEQVSSDYH